MKHFPKAHLVNTVPVEKFYVIAAVSNPIRYYSRARLFHQFRKHMLDCRANLVVIEAAYGNRPHALTTSRNNFCAHHHDDSMEHMGVDINGDGKPDVTFEQLGLREHHVQLRTESELWHKENLINIAIQQLSMIDPNWEAVAWIDADIAFQRDDIVLETMQQLQHYDIVQMFSHVTDLGPQLEPIRMQNGFMWSYIQNHCELPQGAGYGGYYGYGRGNAFWHPGYAWAMRRRAAEKVTLFDKAILGSADHHMAMGLIGGAFKSVPENTTAQYKKAVFEWEEMALTRLRKNVGYVPGMIVHYWHGNKLNRKYVERWKVLIDNKYDPVKDISRDPQGLYKLNMHNGARSIRMRDDIRRYFRQRNEDSIDAE